MAFTDTVIRQTRFDVNLPLYGWQEDRDYTDMALRLGRVIYFPDCRGVHLGVKSGRTGGGKLGYSQIANPVYLMKKGTMGYKIGLKFIGRALPPILFAASEIIPSSMTEDDYAAICVRFSMCF
jgi:hypothetical protein